MARGLTLKGYDVTCFLPWSFSPFLMMRGLSYNVRCGEKRHANDPTKRWAFWTRWLDEAIPAAWEAAE